MTQILTLEGDDSLNLCADELGWGVPKILRPSTYKKKARSISRAVRNPRAFARRKIRQTRNIIRNPGRALKQAGRTLYRATVKETWEALKKASQWAKRMADRLIKKLIGKFVKKYGAKVASPAIKGTITGTSTSIAMSNPATAPYAPYIAFAVWQGITEAVKRLKKPASRFVRRKVVNPVKRMKRRSLHSLFSRRKRKTLVTPKMKTQSDVVKRAREAQARTKRALALRAKATKQAVTTAPRGYVTRAGTPASNFQLWMRGLA